MIKHLFSVKKGNMSKHYLWIDNMYYRLAHGSGDLRARLGLEINAVR